MNKTLSHTTITINGTKYIADKIAARKFGERIKAYDIWDAYARPSYRKVNIWNEWRNILTGPIWVSGYNSCTFSIAGKTTDRDSEKEYFVFITPTYNYCYPVEA